MSFGCQENSGGGKKIKIALQYKDLDDPFCLRKMQGNKNG